MSKNTTGYSQPHLFEGLPHRPLAPALISPLHSDLHRLPHPSRDMAYHQESYYESPTLSRQPLGTRSSSVSSNSSSASFSLPYSTVGGVHHGSIPRTLSPASSGSEPGTDTAMYPRTHYSGIAHDHLRSSPTHHMSLIPSPSQYFQAQVATPLSFCPPMPVVPKQFSRASSYGGYPVTTLQQQPSQLSFQGYDQWCPSYAAPAYQSPDSPPPPPPYQLSSLALRQPVMRKPTPPPESKFLKGLQQLPASVIDAIRKEVGWFWCWKVYQVHRWFRDNFNPDQLPYDLKVAGMLYAEQNWGRYGAEDSDKAVSLKKSETKPPNWHGCYHCFRMRGFEHFELFKWGNSYTPREADEHDEGSSPGSSTTAAKDNQRHLTPPGPGTALFASTNPHYDPTITRSSQLAAARRNRRPSTMTTTTSSSNSRTSPTPSITSSTAINITIATTTTTNTNTNNTGADDPNADPRIRQFWGIRRFCVDCGLAAGLYRPHDLIELQRPPQSGQARWVCDCNKLLWRLGNTTCAECRACVPLSRPSRRR